jgi:hypothetical protein
MLAQGGADDRFRQATWSLGVLAAAAAGAALRLYRLPEQLLTGDELHSVNGALSMGPGEILSTWTYHGADYCVPLTALYRLAMDAGLVMGEMHFRAPVLAASLLTICVLPRLLRARLGPGPSLLLAWLLAISPMLVLYGRIVRSYGPVALCAPTAVLAFDHWWRTGSRSAGGASALLAGVSVWLHLGAAPFVLAPFVFAALSSMRKHRPAGREPERGLGGNPLRRLLLQLVATAGAIALALAPAAASLVDLIGIHGRGHLPSPATWLDVVRLQAGTRSGWLAGLLVLAGLRGVWLLWRRDPDFIALAAVVTVGHVAGLVALAPNFLEALVVANRYVLVLLPLGLAFVSVGLATPPGRWTSPWLRATGAALPIALLGALFATGPFATDEFRWSSFTHAQPFVNFLGAPDHIPPEEVPRFYRELPPGSEPLVEAPWTNVGTHSFNAYQQVHHRPLRVASLNKLHADPRIRLRNTLHARADALARSDARWVVVHLDLREEEEHVTTTELRHHERLERLPELWQVLGGAGKRLAARLREEWGPPVYSDERVRVWERGGSSSEPR